MIAYERVLLEEMPALVVVVGDVNSTMACTIAASKIVYPSSPGQPTQSTDRGPSGSRPAFKRPNHARRDQPARHRCIGRLLWTPSADAVENLIG
jgi:UDP-N-acetylglucosamine 2-epimerase (non-hydrolysing)